MKKGLWRSGVLLLTMFVAGCTNMGGGMLLGQPAQPVVAAPDVVNMRLTEAVESAAHSLRTMALVEQARTPVDTSLDVTEDVPEELKQTVTVSWVGPIEKMVALLADVAGYSFSVMGNPPATPVIVSVEATESRVVDLLRNLGLQAAHTADVSVNVEQRAIEVRYVPIGY